MISEWVAIGTSSEVRPVNPSWSATGMLDPDRLHRTRHASSSDPSGILPRKRPGGPACGPAPAGTRACCASSKRCAAAGAAAARTAACRACPRTTCLRSGAKVGRCGRINGWVVGVRATGWCPAYLSYELLQDVLGADGDAICLWPYRLCVCVCAMMPPPSQGAELRGRLSL